MQTLLTIIILLFAIGYLLLKWMPGSLKTQLIKFLESCHLAPASKVLTVINRCGSGGCSSSCGGCSSSEPKSQSETVKPIKFVR